MKSRLITLLLVVLIAFPLFGLKNVVPREYRDGRRAQLKVDDYMNARINAECFGQIWFVDSGVTTSGNGREQQRAFKTIAEALTAASDDDWIIISAGDYLLTDTLEVENASLHIIGAGGNQNSNEVLIYNNTSVAAFDLMHIKAHNVEIANIGFTTTNDSCSAIKVSTAASKYKVWIHDCRFDGYGAGEYAIHTGSTYDSPDILVEDCLIRSFTTAGIYANATRGLYRNNIIHVDASTIGIEHVPTTTSRPDQVYIGNFILGANSTDTGIKITNSPSAGTYLMIQNIVANCNTTITGKNTNDAACILNYTGDSTGAVLIDPSP